MQYFTNNYMTFDQACQWLEEQGFTIERDREYWDITMPDSNRFIRTSRKRNIIMAVNELADDYGKKKDAQSGVLTKSGCPVDIDSNHMFYRKLPQLYDANPLLLVEGRWQPRNAYDLDELNELVESIRANGLVSRPVVFENERNKLEIVGGHRRTLAAIIAGLDHIPVEVKVLTARQAMEHSLIDNFNRVDLTPIEEAESYKMMLDMLDISQVKLAKRLGVTRGKIQQRLELIGAAPGLIKALKNGEITLGVARGILAVAKGSMNVQEQTIATLPKVYIKKINERAARETAFNVLMTLHYPTEDEPKILVQLRELGWSVGQVNLNVSKNERIYCHRIWSHEVKPFWRNAREIVAIIDAGEKIEQPKSQPLPDAIIALAHLFDIQYRSAFEPWIRVSAEYMSRDEFTKMINGKIEKLDELRKQYEAQGYSLDLKVNPAQIIICDPEGVQVLRTHRYGEACRKAKDFAAYLEKQNTKSRKCAECGMGKNLSSGFDDDWREKGYESGWNYFCDSCLVQIKKKKSENRKEAIKQIKGELGFVNDLSEKEIKLLAVVLSCGANAKKLLSALASQIFIKARHNLDHLL
jgi:ParB/RepB/Spo0J family partition protein